MLNDYANVWQLDIASLDVSLGGGGRDNGLNGRRAALAKTMRSARQSERGRIDGLTSVEGGGWLAGVA